ncbi:MAG: hypothetical protein C0403_16650 [Desulfobacterium sp.]|nr:hypothetical protein [Desulfobacterium sp.]
MASLKKIALIIILFHLLPATAMAAKNRIAVMDFRADGISKEKALRISELIRTEIVNTNVYTVIERNQMDMVFKEQGIQQTGVINDAYAIKMGELLSAQKILIGTVMQLGDAIIISGRIVDIEKGIAEFAVNQSAANENQLLEATRLFCKKLTGTSSQTAEISGIKKKKSVPKPVADSTDIADQEKKTTVSTPKKTKTESTTVDTTTSTAQKTRAASTTDKKRAASTTVSTANKTTAASATGAVKATSQAASTALTASATGTTIKKSTKTGADVVPNKKVYAPYEEIELSFSNFPGNNYDWISIALPDEPENYYQTYAYSGSGLKEGKITLGGLAPGKYEIRYYYNYENGKYDYHVMGGLTVSE